MEKRSVPSLFDPIRLGALDCPNRIFMAPLTRGRATRAHVPTQLMQIYYAQRAGAGLILAEATGISRQGLGWPYAPGIWTDDQVAAWIPVTDAVHRAGGRIFCQLWHMGRTVHSSFAGAPPVSACATSAPGKAHTYEGRQPYEQSHALAIREIRAIVADYVAAAGRAMAAGFDGVHIHAANGYLIDQFLRDGTNRRTDIYGGSIENRIRLLREVVQAVSDVVGPARASVRLSPNGEAQGVNDSHPHLLFPAAAAALEGLGIAFLELREPPRDGTFGQAEVDPIAPLIRGVFSGPLVLNSDYTNARAEAAVATGFADAISFGRPFIANPDLAHRLAGGIDLASDRREHWYTRGAEGYVDYPVSS
jgi:N-ethylmaleimide reductase